MMVNVFLGTVTLSQIISSEQIFIGSQATLVRLGRECHHAPHAISRAEMSVRNEIVQWCVVPAGKGHKGKFAPLINNVNSRV